MVRWQAQNNNNKYCFLWLNCITMCQQHVPEVLDDALQWLQRTGEPDICNKVLELGSKQICFVAIQYIFAECKCLRLSVYVCLIGLALSWTQHVLYLAQMLISSNPWVWTLKRWWRPWRSFTWWGMSRWATLGCSHITIIMCYGTPIGALIQLFITWPMSGLWGLLGECYWVVFEQEWAVKCVVLPKHIFFSFYISRKVKWWKRKGMSTSKRGTLKLLLSVTQMPSDTRKWSCRRYSEHWALVCCSNSDCDPLPHPHIPVDNLHLSKQPWKPRDLWKPSLVLYPVWEILVSTSETVQMTLGLKTDSWLDWYLAIFQPIFMYYTVCTKH